MSLRMSESPYQRSPRTTFKIMMELTAALLIVWLAAVIYNFTLSSEFGVRAILLMVVALFTTALIDAGVALIKHKKGGNLLKEVKDSVVFNYSYVTAIIFTLCCPVYISYFIIIIGCLASTGIKHCFGGFGKNIFNPAIIGRIVTGIAFPTAFQVTESYADVTASATLTTQYSGLGTKWLSGVLPEGYNMGNLLLGNYGGSLGETFTLLILILGIILMVRKVINWKSSVFYLGTVAITALFIGFFIEGVNPITYMMYHLCLGGLMFGAIFMITDPVTSPTSPFGKALIGVIAGLITVLIRVAGGYPEGVMYSIALINIISPVIDKLVVGRTTEGQTKKWAVIGSFLVASIAINTALSVSSANAGGNTSNSDPSTSETTNSSSSSVVLSKEEQLFGYQGATYTEVTLGELPADTHIVKIYSITGKNVPTVLGYELNEEYSWSTGYSNATINVTVGVVFSLEDDTVLDVNLYGDTYGTKENFMTPVDEFVDKLVGLNVSNLVSMNHVMSNDKGSHNGCAHDSVDFVTGSSKSKGTVFNLVVEAAKQYLNSDKLSFIFGNGESTYEQFTMTNNDTVIKEAYTYTVDTVTHIGYLVSVENGINISSGGHSMGKIYPLFAISINTSNDTISGFKLISGKVTEGYSRYTIEPEEVLKKVLLNKDVNTLIGTSGSSAIDTANNTDLKSGATLTSQGIYNYVVTVCNQYVTNDKANIGGAQ